MSDTIIPHVHARGTWDEYFAAIAKQASIRRIVFGEFYRDERIFDAAKALGIELVGPEETAR